MLKPLVSVVIPTYNYGAYLPQALDSVLAQTYAPVEIIVVDDGSNDDTQSALAPYRKRIGYVFQKNQGPEGARNTGLALARGEYIAFLDPDDSWLPEKLQLQMEVFAQNPECCLVCTDIADSDSRRDGGCYNLTTEEIHLHNPICTSTVVVSARHLRQTGHFRKGIRSEDWDLWMRLARAGRVIKLDRPLVAYRDHAANRSKNVDAELPWAVRVVEDNFAQLPGTLHYRRLRRQALARVYLSGSRLYHLSSRLALAWRTLGKSALCWPFGFPAPVRRASFERVKFGIRLLRDVCQRRFTRKIVSR